jgi:FixJ family two-component response regulator
LIVSSDRGISNRPVFVLDDHPAIRASLRRLLEAHGFKTQLFDSPEAFRAWPNPDEGLCLVLDVNLKVGSGIELRRQLTSSGSSLPVIFMTASDSVRLRKQAIDAGCLAFLVKPFSSQSLLRAIAKAVALRGAT